MIEMVLHGNWLIALHACLEIGTLVLGALTEVISFMKTMAYPCCPYMVFEKCS